MSPTAPLAVTGWQRTIASAAGRNWEPAQAEDVPAATTTPRVMYLRLVFAKPFFGRKPSLTIYSNWHRLQVSALLIWVKQGK